MTHFVHTLISGGQTGADQAGLIAGRILGYKTGGTAPKGWRTQAGPQPLLAQYGLVESIHSTYPPRTLENVMNSDGTLVFGDITSPGGRLTRNYCIRAARPYYHASWAPGKALPDAAAFLRWLQDHRVSVLNVAGNREESAPGINLAVQTFLHTALGPKA